MQAVAKAAGSRAWVGYARHQVVVTEPHEALAVDRFGAMVFDIHAGIYWRPEEGGLLWGMSNPHETPGPGPRDRLDVSAEDGATPPPPRAGDRRAGDQEGVGGHDRVHARPPAAHRPSRAARRRRGGRRHDRVRMRARHDVGAGGGADRHGSRAGPRRPTSSRTPNTSGWIASTRGAVRRSSTRWRSPSRSGSRTIEAGQARPTSTRMSSESAAASIRTSASSTICAASPVRIRSPLTAHVALDHVEVDAATLPQRVGHRRPAREPRDDDVRVLMDEDGVAAVAADHAQERVGPVVLREHPLFDAGRQPMLARHDPHLDEPHRLRLAGVLLAVPGAGPERHPLDRAGRQRTGGAAHVVLVAEEPLDDVGEALDVAMRMHRPDGARHEAVVIEDSQRPEPDVVGIDVGVERVVPAGSEPLAVDVADLIVAPDRDRHGDHRTRGGRNAEPQGSVGLTSRCRCTGSRSPRRPGRRSRRRHSGPRRAPPFHPWSRARCWSAWRRGCSRRPPGAVAEVSYFVWGSKSVACVTP